jgi:hypothetical protein
MDRRSSRFRRFEAEASQPVTSNRLLVALAICSLLFSLPLLVNIVGRMQAETRMRAERDRIAAEVSVNEKCRAQLDAAVEYAKSDAYVEQWARERERLGKSGEVIIVPASADAASQTIRPWWEQQVDCKRK